MQPLAGSRVAGGRTGAASAGLGLVFFLFCRMLGSCCVFPM